MHVYTFSGLAYFNLNWAFLIAWKRWKNALISNEKLKRGDTIESAILFRKNTVWWFYVRLYLSHAWFTRLTVQQHARNSTKQQGVHKNSWFVTHILVFEHFWTFFSYVFDNFQSFYEFSYGFMRSVHFNSTNTHTHTRFADTLDRKRWISLPQTFHCDKTALKSRSPFSHVTTHVYNDLFYW